MDNIKTVQQNSAMLKSSYTIPTLPLPHEIESTRILKQLVRSHKALAELRGVATSMPRQEILLNTLSLQEAKDSSAIENIITTHDELYQNDAALGQFTSLSAKEVHHYASALIGGFQVVKQTGLLTNKSIKTMQATLEGNNSGFRSQSGTTLKNDATGEVIYTPPQSLQEIETAMKNLEGFINDNNLCSWDALTKMAVIHHQFESIHPFFDGNGRTGRMINILYLVQQDLLDMPILYLSRFINQYKSDYYRLLQAVRDDGVWEEWIMFILLGVENTAYQTIRLIQEIKRIMQNHKQTMRAELPKIYSQDLLNTIFNHPYTKIAHVEEGSVVSRLTATKYLDELVRIGLMTKVKLSRESYYINTDLMNCLSEARDI
jgi:Fic family protein